MSAAAATKIAGALWKGFKWILERIGKWVLRDLWEYGRVALTGYMRVRVGVFRKRLRRARAKWRKRWLSGRINRWCKAIDWLKAKRQKIRLKTLEAFDVLSKKIPDRSPWERAA